MPNSPAPDSMTLIDPAAESIICLDFCAQHGVDYQRFQHPAAHTVEDAKRYSHDIPGAHCKNLFLKARKNQYWIVTIPAEAMIDLAALAVVLNVPRLSLGSPVRMAELLRINPGSVSPLAVIHDHQHKVKVAVDVRLQGASLINFPPLDNRQTLQLTIQSFIDYMAAAEHPVSWVQTQSQRC